jgi:hypothetical protein
MLVRALGETRCRSCSFAKSAEPSSRRTGDSTLADDVAAALRRRFSDGPPVS